MQELPDTAKVIADIIGREATLKLAAVTKHRKLYVPNHLDDDHWITRTIGREAATKLHKTFRGELLPLATCHLIHVAERNDRIRADYINGVKVLNIMRDHGMSLRAVRYVVAKVKGQRGRAVKVIDSLKQTIKNPTIISNEKPTGNRKNTGRRNR